MALKFVQLTPKTVEAPPPPPKAKKAKKKPVVETATEVVPDVIPDVHVPPVGTTPDLMPMTATEALTSEFCALYKRFVEYDMKDVVKRMEDIKKQLQSIANETMDPKKPATFHCPDGSVTFSEQGKSYEVADAMALVTALNEKFGPDVAFSVVKIALTPLRTILSDAELKKHLKEEPGFRTLKLVQLG